MKTLIEKFILENLPNINKDNDVEEEFNKFWKEETKKALENLCIEEKLQPFKVEDIINDYLFTERKPNEDQIINALEKQPSVLERETLGKRITDKIINFVNTFIDGIN